MRYGQNRGFTLVEISIVLVIIGLLVSATLVGVGLIRSSENRIIMAKVDEYRSALTQFELLYSSLPGDMNNAEDYWSTTSNGDGNGQIDAETSDEPFTALEQLKIADLIQGTFSGAWGGAFVTGDGGNVPDITGGTSLYVKCCSTTDYARTLDFKNHIVVFNVNSDDSAFRSGAITPIEALNIDNKLDDGFPDYGFVGASGSYSGAYDNGNCYTNTGTDSTYNSADETYKDSQECQMLFAYDWN